MKNFRLANIILCIVFYAFAALFMAALIDLAIGMGATKSPLIGITVSGASYSAFLLLFVCSIWAALISQSNTKKS